MPSLPAHEAALSANGLPYVRVGEGKDPLVIFTSTSPASRPSRQKPCVSLDHATE